MNTRKVMNGKLEMSSYPNGNGDIVTLYKNNSGNCASIVCGQITMYSTTGDMMCGARDEDSAINLLIEWDSK
jgi:hypothetical protein